MAGLIQRVAEFAQDAMYLSLMKDNYKGLGIFITEIRRCKSKEQESKRVNKELVNIRGKFRENKPLSGYQKKKYMAKLVLIYLLGYKIDFGVLNAINLISSEKFTEKNIGYLFLTMTFSAELDAEYMPLLIRALKNDLNNTQAIFQVMAVQAIANMCVSRLIEDLFPPIYSLCSRVYGDDHPCLPSLVPCLTSMIRIEKTVSFCQDSDVKMINFLIRSRNPTISSTAVILLDELMQLHPAAYASTLRTVFELIKHNINHRSNTLPLALATGSTTPQVVSQPHAYYYFHRPWMLLKLLRLLSRYQFEGEVETLSEIINLVLGIVSVPDKSKRSHYLNIKYAILFEVVNLITQMDPDTQIVHRVCSLLSKPLNCQDPTQKGLALKYLNDIAKTSSGSSYVQGLVDNIMRELKSLKNSGIRKVGVDLAYTICNSENAQMIITQLIDVLPNCGKSYIHDLAIKIATLVEKYTKDDETYIAQMLSLVRICGDHLSEDVWFRVVHTLSHKENARGYAAQQLFKYLKIQEVSESMIRLAVYVLGEYGNLIANDPISSPINQFNLIYDLFPFVSSTTKHMMIVAFGKLRNLFSELRDKVEEALSSKVISTSIDVELQQRAMEVLTLSRLDKQGLLRSVFEVMPVYKFAKTNLYTQSLSGLNRSINLTGRSMSQDQEMANPQDAKQDDYYTFVDETLDPILNTANPTKTTPKLPLNSDLVNNFGLKRTGLLFSEAVDIVVELAAMNQTSSLPINLLIRNKHPSRISNITIHFPDSQPMSNHFEVVTSSINCIEAQSEGLLTLRMTQVQVITEFIHFFVSYSDVHNNKSSLPLYLPVQFYHFNTPITLTPEDFYYRWQDLSETTSVEPAVFFSKKQLDDSFIRNVLTEMGFEVISGIDPSPSNHCAVSALKFENSAKGIMLRLETNQSARAYRLTVRSSIPDISQLTLNTLTSLLS